MMSGMPAADTTIEAMGKPRRRVRPVERFKQLLPIVLLVAVAVAGMYVWTNLAGWLASPDRLHAVDVVVVPAGDPDVRVPRSVALLNKHASEVWVIPSGSGPVLREIDAIAAYAKRSGHADDVKVLPRRSRSLVKDARYIATRLHRLEREGDVRITLAVLSSPLEIARTRLVFERETDSDVAAWRDGSRGGVRNWQALVGESARVLATLAVLGPGTALAPGQGVPASLPLRAFAGGALVAFAVGALCRPLARRLGLVAIPRLWRAHTTPTPMLGGLAIIAGLGGGIVAAGGVRLGAVGAAAAAGVIVVAVVGLIDDIAGLGTRVRLLWAAGAGTVAWLLGLRAQMVSPGATASDLVNALATVLWFVGVTQALNFFDNLDGTTGGVAALSAGAIAVAAALGGQSVVAVAAAALAGGSLGYLVHNVHPARLFMGDMGALGLGFTLAALGLALKPQAGPPLSMFVPLLAIGIPIFDIVLVVITRIARGSSPAIGGTDHGAHRLLARGMTVRQSAAFLWGAQAVLGLAAVALARTAGLGIGIALTAAVMAGGVVALVVFARMEPWRPPTQMQASAEVVDAVERAMRALRHLEDAVGEEAWRLSNPRAARSTQETLKRLERVHTLLERPSETGGQTQP
jgi:UDP-GlcNAc:undecaprenyl-phosphate GlcNAc-1-phosphate transferase